MQIKSAPKKATISRSCPQSQTVAQVQYTVMHAHLATSWPVIMVWVLLSFLVSTMATVAYVHPEWFVKEDHDSRPELLRYDREGLSSTIGMVSVCYRNKNRVRHSDLECHNFGEDFPSGLWQTAYILYGSGCVLLTWCAILAFCIVWVVGQRNRQLLSLLVGRIQLVAVVLQTVSLFLYPLVLGSPFIQLHCGARAEVYYPATCRLGWAYMAAITATCLAYYCPLLAHFTLYNVFTPCYWTNI